MYWLISLLLTCAFSHAAATDAVAAAPQADTGRTVARIVVYDETERFSQTYPFNSNGTISISEINGSITIEAWDNQQIQLEYEKIASSRERLADLEVNIQAGLDNFMIKSRYKSKNKNWNGGKLHVNYVLRVPRGAVLDKINSINGNILIADMTGPVSASTVNGEVTAKNLRGQLKISSVNGSVTAEVSEIGIGSKINMSTVNGTVNLFLPGSVDAVFQASTVNGLIKNDLGLEVIKKKHGSGSRLNATLGSGSSMIRLNSVNGTIDINRGSVNL